MSNATHGDSARCLGVGDDTEGWREGCEHCLRRITPPHGPDQRWIDPPLIVVFWCEYLLGAMMNDEALCRVILLGIFAAGFLAGLWAGGVWG